MARISHAIPFDAQHPDALALYCSDGRFTDAVEALLRELGYPRLDTLTIPGGAALLEHTSASLGGVETVRDAVSFLIAGHKTKHVVLVAHESCGYYKGRLPYDSPESMLRRQLADLRAAERWLRSGFPGIEVTKFYAWRAESAVEFEPIE
jgi:carbonic anhydrase